MADRIIKNAGNDFQLIIGDDNITYQDLKKHRQAVIPYDNIDCIEFNKLRTGTGFTRELEVVIELIDEQPDIYGYTMEMVFVGCYMDYELTSIINFVNSKVD